MGGDEFGSDLLHDGDADAELFDYQMSYLLGSEQRARADGLDGAGRSTETILAL